jgi:putative transposase
VLRAYKYKLYPNMKQAEKLQWVLDRCRELYNSALQERRDAYEMTVKRHPNYYDETTRKQLTQEHALNYHQQALLRKKRRSKRRRKAAQQIGKAHRHLRNQRKDFHHKQARKLVNHYQTIVFEKLQPANMSKRPKPKQDEATGHYLPNGASAKAGLNKSILDAGWGQFQQMCVSKAESAGSHILFVSPKYTSQMCSGCGTIQKKELDERWHSCSCGTELDRDHNAAINILRVGRQTIERETALGRSVQRTRL